jgi:hypothetical protein
MSATKTEWHHVPRPIRYWPEMRFNRLSQLERLLSERREREIENNNTAGAMRALRWEERVRAELMVSAPFDVTGYSDFP